MTLHAVIYARYSSDLQSAARAGWRITGTYHDAAISGASLRRPGIQRLQRDARERRFDIVLSEAPDRLSRNQADIAALYQNLTFAGTAIQTQDEGRIDELHIGLKGTMNALFLKDLAAETRRSLRGGVEAGKSGGGNAFGYTVLRSLTEDGEVRRGDRQINEDEAAVVRRIFHAYAEGCRRTGLPTS